MFIKKFLADSVMDAMDMVRSELGEEAIILHTKKVKRGGLLKFLAKERIEVLAALDNGSTKESKTYKSPRQSAPDPFQWADLISDEGTNEIRNRPARAPEEEKNAKPSRNGINSHVFPAKHQEEQYMSKNEYYSIKSEVTGIKDLMNELKGSIENSFAANKHDNEFEKSEIFENESIKKLLDKGLPKSLIEEFVERNNGIIESGKEIGKEIIDFIIGELSQTGKAHNAQNKFNIFIGPTGVGKTTTLAKIASDYVLNHGEKVGFVTLDTYRVAAAEQLKVYSEILDMSMQVAYSSESLRSSIERADCEDTVFVDTAGRSHKNKMHMKELERLINEFDCKNIFLVVSANVNMDDIEDIISGFGFVENFDIIVTKLDETSRPLSVLDIIYKFKKNIAYITFGQSVPDDIRKFDMADFLDNAMRGN